MSIFFLQLFLNILSSDISLLTNKSKNKCERFLYWILVAVKKNIKNKRVLFFFTATRSLRIFSLKFLHYFWIDHFYSNLLLLSKALRVQTKNKRFINSCLSPKRLGMDKYAETLGAIYNHKRTKTNSQINLRST